MPSKWHPLSNRILIRRQEPESVSRGGILLPDQAKGKSCRGEVLAVGPGRWCSELLSSELSDVCREPMDVKVGDVVLFSQYSGNQIPDDDTLLVLSVDEVLAVEVRRS